MAHSMRILNKICRSRKDPLESHNAMDPVDEPAIIGKVLISPSDHSSDVTCTLSPLPPFDLKMITSLWLLVLVTSQILTVESYDDVAKLSCLKWDSTHLQSFQLYDLSYSSCLLDTYLQLQILRFPFRHDRTTLVSCILE